MRNARRGSFPYGKYCSVAPELPAGPAIVL
jgi:hypothetical protein